LFELKIICYICGDYSTRITELNIIDYEKDFYFYTRDDVAVVDAGTGVANEL
jgi:hypothetical protein